MVERTERFTFQYVSREIAYGRGCVASLQETLAEASLERALIVCGHNVGANSAVMDPLTDALGDQLVGVFDETTPDKRIETVLDGVDQVTSTESDVLIGVGGGSSLNIMRAMSSVAPLERSRESILTEVVNTGTVPAAASDVEPIPNIAIPTTMAGADLSAGGSVFYIDPSTEARQRASIADARLGAKTVFYDPDLFETTPTSVLASSAMNGFDKGIETLYSRVTNPLCNANAASGLGYYADSLQALTDEPRESEVLENAVLGTIQIQFGKYTNVIHTFGNGLSMEYDIQQGAVHGIMAPHVLRFVFDRVDGNRTQIAAGLNIETATQTDDEIGAAIIDNVIEIRDALELPSQLRAVPGIDRSELPALAAIIAQNPKHQRNPEGINPSEEDILSVLEAAW